METIINDPKEFRVTVANVPSAIRRSQIEFDSALCPRVELGRQPNRRIMWRALDEVLAEAEAFAQAVSTRGDRHG